VSSFAVIMYKQWPLHAPVLNYREFQYLQHLKFILPCFNSNLLVNVLKKCRMLQVLIIQSNMVCLLLKFNSISLWPVYVYISLYSTHKYTFDSWCLLFLVGGTIFFKNMGAAVNNSSYMSQIPPDLYSHRRISRI
jgi:hypothetical protein